ncbi:MAG: RHS repeat protein, partial [Actinobacteria bacterium]|nr:RHS repeat protein [Actinomycetota bacterium]NIS34686.1 RHS repeat protein [Actinomycetota bacterium]NIU69446.1 RHS repeat protein [Actinomycetota bacterium]NIW31311.1 hypothetical protein [Actinomycetota bacterium]
MRAGYANIGRLTSSSDAHGGMTVNYDARGRVVRATRTTDGRGYTFEKGYDAAGRLLWTHYPDGDSIGTASNPL